MPNPLLAAFVDDLRSTVPFQTLPAMSRPLETLWSAHNQTLLAMRQPLYGSYLRPGKARPKPKDYATAVQSGLAILAAYANATGTKQAIVRFTKGKTDAISFQPRPSGANWTKQHALTGIDRAHDPMVETNEYEAVTTADILFLAEKTVLTFIGEHTNPSIISGTATFVFFDPTKDTPNARLVLRYKEFWGPERTELRQPK
jgi:hypothetical protein